MPVYRWCWKKLDEPFRQDKYNELSSKIDKKEEKKDSSKKSGSRSSNPSVLIPWDLLMERLEQLRSCSSAPSSCRTLPERRENKRALYRQPRRGRSALWKTVIEPFSQLENGKIAGTDNSFGFDVVEVSDKLYVNWAMEPSAKLEPLMATRSIPSASAIPFRRNLAAEFSQMFEEAPGRSKRIL